MLYREEWEFDLRVIDDMDRPEYETLAAVLNGLLKEQGIGVHVASEKSDLMTLSIARVEAT